MDPVPGVRCDYCGVRLHHPIQECGICIGLYFCQRCFTDHCRMLHPRGGK